MSQCSKSDNVQEALSKKENTFLNNYSTVVLKIHKILFKIPKQYACFLVQ